MQFTIIREELLRPLQMVMGAVEKRHAMPILANALLRVTEQQLTVIATDLEVELHGTVQLNSVVIPGEITVPARKLLDICRALPETKLITLVLQGDTILISCEKSRFKLTTLPAVDFPNVEEGISKQEFLISPMLLRNLIENVSFSMAYQDVRYYLNGIFIIKSSSSLKVVATDGHRLSLCSHSADLGDGDEKVIIPRKAVVEMIRLLNSEEPLVNINIGENHLRVVGKNYTFVTKLIDGVFPDYQRVIPKNAHKQIVLDKELFKNMLSRTAILSNEKYHGVKLFLEPDKLAVEAHNSEYEEAYEEVEVLYNSDPLEIGFNVSYLLEAINALPKGNIRMLLVDGNSSIQIEAENSNGSLYVIMPMRI